MNPGHNPCQNPCHRNLLRHRIIRRILALLAGFSAVLRRGTPSPFPARPAPETRAGKSPPAPERNFRCNPCHGPEIGRNPLRLYPLPWPGFLADISALLTENPCHRARIPATHPPPSPTLASSALGPAPAAGDPSHLSRAPSPTTPEAS